MSCLELVESLHQGKLSEAQKVLSGILSSIVEAKLLEVRKMIASGSYMKEVVSELRKPRPHKWYSIRKQGRLKIIPIRVRTLSGSTKPVVQRRKKFASVKGFTFRGGKVIRMKAAEKLHRKRGARRAKIKRRAKRARIHMRFERSLRKRHSLGLR